MRLLTRLLAACLLAACLLAFTAIAAPAAENPPHNLRTFARDAGLPDSVEVHLIESEDPDGYYIEAGVYCFLFICMEYPETVAVFAPKDWPREYVLSVLLHEVGHYHQHAAGLPFDEWDADVRGIRELCRAGLNGPEVAAGALTELWVHGAIVDSESHGNLFARIAYARSRTCSGEPRPVDQSL